VRAVATHLLAATAVMSMWTWVVIATQVHFFHLALLAAALVLRTAMERFLKRHKTRRKEKQT
jgi:membrane protein implicated in regulation of membrane protease activity